jgi:hypothetical protein
MPSSFSKRRFALLFLKSRSSIKFTLFLQKQKIRILNRIMTHNKIMFFCTNNCMLNTADLYYIISLFFLETDCQSL